MKKILIIIVMLMVAVMQNVNAESGSRELTDKDRQYLLNLARETVSGYLKDRSVPEPVETQLSDNVRKNLGCFVTLEHKKKGLRGCLGIFERSQPLYKNVISRAIAATQDSRFRRDPVTHAELKDIDIEISVLTAPVDMAFDSPDDLLDGLRPSVDGVILYTRYGSSTYLPQVWEHFSKKEDFLSQLCMKHGAPGNTWKKDYKNVRVQKYQAIVFSEESHGVQD